MTSNPRAKQILLNLLSNSERLLVETHALKVMLSTSNLQEIRDTWEASLHMVLQQPEVQACLAEVHAKFDELHTQASSAIDEEVVFGILLGMPTSGKAN